MISNKKECQDGLATCTDGHLLTKKTIQMLIEKNHSNAHRKNHSNDHRKKPLNAHGKKTVSCLSYGERLLNAYQAEETHSNV